MTIRFMLDTDVCIHLLRRNTPPALQDRFREASASIALSTIVVTELWVGEHKRAGEPKDRFYRLIDGLLISDYDMPAAAHAADIRSELEAAGRKIGPMDTLIAGHARSLGAVLVTSNLREFSRVPGLRAQDWLTPNGSIG